MTRETKIGLLVGLAFIIVVGILLSDHFRTTMDPPQAMLDRAGYVVRQAINSPGSGQVTLPADPIPQEVSPHVPVQTQRDLEPNASPIKLAPTPGNASANGNDVGDSGHASVAPVSLAADALTDAARQQGQELINADQPPQGSNGTSKGTPAAPIAPATAARMTTRTYRAVAGDSVSRLAARFLGANNHANRQAIIDANASLKENADRIIVGQSYVIPTPATAPGAGQTSALAARTSGVAATPAGSQSAHTASASAAVYVVKSGDTLWKIARNEVGDPGAIAAIVDLNPALHGGTTVRVGMKLHLPGKTVASAN